MSNVFKLVGPFTTPLTLLVPNGKTTVKGVTKKSYKNEGLIFCKFKSFGGTETLVNGVLSIIDTASIETWYRPDITSDCKLVTMQGYEYEILGVPENIEMRNQYLKFKVKRVDGRA